MTEQVKEQSGVTRRDFLKASSGVALGIVVGGAFYKLIPLGDGAVAYAMSEGYLLVDTEKCSACNSCMFACSLAHEGEVSLSLSRIQVIRNPFENFPHDIEQTQCRQCVYPACAEACPTGALHVDAENGNVRVVDQDKCIGCMSCIEACPQQPAGVQWNPEQAKSQKCDLCAETPHWDGEEPACITVCPMEALAFTNQIPAQQDAGYKVDLKPPLWGAEYWSENW